MSTPTSGGHDRRRQRRRLQGVFTVRVRLIDVQHALLYRWRLPTRLIAVLDGHKTENQLQVRTVELAVRMARHTAQGWKDAAIPDDLIEIGRLLQLSPENVRRLIIDIDRD